jgi:para-aminobenzoate synthetase / 4-amino-4-deoxychorismate lyase
MDTIEPQINEILLKQNDGWLYFSHPHRVIEIQKPGELIPALREIEDLVNAKDWHAAGFLSYEAAPAFDQVLRVLAERSGAKSEGGFPLLWFGLYPAPRISDLPEPASPKPAFTWSPTVPRDTYNAAIDQIKNHIVNGRTYQVNYTMRLQTGFDADPWNFFLHLAQTQNNHAAYIDTGRFVIASASPELFFQLDGDTITGRPMKGTVKRGRTTTEDKEQAEWLRRSEKNRAENVMIVDMIRNDLGRIAKVGSVHVPELFTTEKYPTLWQMTSTVKATTSASVTNIFKALFPCASITGAPKVSTMRIISELETTPRKIYTGSIGYIAPNRKATFNVAIRTALIDRETQTAEYGVGGGIVWDSTSTDEYAEALLKARVLTESPPKFSLLDTMLWTPEEGFFLREKHLARLLDSAEYFDIPISRDQRWLSSPARSSQGVSKPPIPKEIIETYLDEISSQFTSPQRVRLFLDKNGNFNYEAKSFQPTDNDLPMKVRLAKEPVSSGNVFLFHKTTHREIYDTARKDLPGCDDVLLYNEHGELTEFTIGNLVVEMDGRLYTPPVSCGLLAGTFRAFLLESGQVEEKVLRLDELENCTRIFLINSVRKMQLVELLV